MTLGSIRPGDLVLIDKRGLEFVAVVRKKEPGGLAVEPLDSRFTYHHAAAREVVGHWSKRANSRNPPTRASATQTLAAA